MTVTDKLLPPDTELGLHPDRKGPLRAADFEGWHQEPDNPMELIEGWVVPMTPGNLSTGRLLSSLVVTLAPLAEERNWILGLDARHRLPQPPDTVVYPDLVIHCAPEVGYLPGTETVGRVPELVIELLSAETAERDRAPRGAKLRAYEMSGIREYYYCWPDGREASGFHLDAGRFASIPPDDQGFFPSPLLGGRLRLAPAAFQG